MRKYAIGIGVVLLAVVILVIFLLSRTHRPQQKIYQSNYTATNIQFPYLADGHTVDFFTGSAFAAYDLDTHTTKTLGPQVSLPTISNVQWSSTGVLFEASNSTPSDDLYPAASRFQLDPSQEYWVLYNFSTQRFTYINGANQGIQTTAVRWVNGEPGIYDYVANDSVASSDNHLLFSDSSGIAQLEYADPTKIIYTTASSSPSIKERDLGTGKTTTLVSGTIKNPLVATSGRYLIYVDHYDTRATGNTPGDLELLSLQTHKVTRIMNGFEGTTSLNNDTDILISSRMSSSPPELLRYDLTTGKLTVLNNSALDQNNIAASLWVIDPNNYIVDSLANLLIVFRDQPAKQPLYPNYDYLLQGDFYKTGFEIHYRNDSGVEVYNIYITQDPYLQYQQQALQYIRSLKIDPNLINIKWYSNDGIARPVYVDAGAS